MLFERLVADHPGMLLQCSVNKLGAFISGPLRALVAMRYGSDGVPEGAGIKYWLWQVPCAAIVIEVACHSRWHSDTFA